jgi:sortase A
VTRRDGRNARFVAAAWALALVVAAVGLGARARAGDSSPPEPVRSEAATDAPVPAVASTTVPTTTTTATTATTAPVGALPVPQPPPADARAPTPEVVLGTLALPSIGVTAPLGEGVTLTQVDRSPGHWPGTALPGQAGNVVVAGHRVTHSRPFYDLDLLEPGDPLVFTMTDGTTWTYRHTGTEIVDDRAIHIIDQAPGHTATLFACHPKHSAAQRIVARFTLEMG